MSQNSLTKFNSKSNTAKTNSSTKSPLKTPITAKIRSPRLEELDFSNNASLENSQEDITVLENEQQKESSSEPLKITHAKVGAPAQKNFKPKFAIRKGIIMMKIHRIIDLLDSEFHVLQRHINLQPREAYMNYLFAPKVKIMAQIDKLVPEVSVKRGYRMKKTKMGPGELIKRKWEHFEELRLSITAQAKRLAGFSKHLEIIENENQKLKVEYKMVVGANNNRVTALMKENEAATLKIYAKQDGFKQLWKEMSRKHTKITNELDLAVELKQIKLKRIETELKEMTKDVQDLKAFEGELATAGTARYDRLLVDAKMRRQAKIENRELQIKNAEEKWTEEEAEFSARYTMHVSKFMQGVHTKFSARMAANALKQNMTLCFAIEKQKELCVKLEIDVKRELNIKNRLSKAGIYEDPRRKVFNMPQQMTCTPEMSF